MLQVFIFDRELEMNSHTTWGNSGARASSLHVGVIISADRDDRYVVHNGSGQPGCPRVAWSNEFDNIIGLGPHIEAAVLSELGLRVDFVDVLSFTIPDLYVLVSAHEPIAGRLPPGVGVMNMADLLSHGAEPAVVQQFRMAADRLFAERFAAGIGVRVRRALDRSADCLESAFAVRGGRAGWSRNLSDAKVGVLSSAQGLLALVHAGRRSREMDQAARSLEEVQNGDGGWQVRNSLVGIPNEISITESTCYCLWALVEAGRGRNDTAISNGTAWLMATQQLSGGWRASEGTPESQVIPTAFAVRILARLDIGPAMHRGVDWLRKHQARDGGWAFHDNGTETTSMVAPTAHAAISLLSAAVPADDPAVARACDYLRDKFDHLGTGPPWPSVTASTPLDKNEDSSLSFGHFATPWALVALILAGADLSDPLLQRGLDRLLELQEPTGVWLDPFFANDRWLWAVHDAVFALRTVVNMAVTNLAPMTLRDHTEQSSQVLESVIVGLLAESPRRRRGMWRP